MTDGFPQHRNAGEGFGGGVTNPLLLADVRMTAWSYNKAGLEDAQFIEWKIINRSTDRIWEDTRMGIFVDANIGDPGNEYLGSDTTRKLGYAYVGLPNDGTGTGNSYGQFPPAYGLKIFEGPFDKLTNIDQTFSCLIKIKNSGSSLAPCEADANGEPMGAYNFLSGLKKDSTPWINPQTNQIVRYLYPGDPEAGTGWTEFQGSILNCNRELTGTILNVNPPSQRRILMGNGKDNFKVLPGDTQNIIVAQLVQQGANHKNSVTRVKKYSDFLQSFYESGFKYPYNVPTPQVNTSVTHLGSNFCEVNLFWGDVSESFRQFDTLFFHPSDTNIYEFEGYEIYEVNKNTNYLPDFQNPITINQSDIQLVAIYDKRNSIGFVIDTLPTGVGNYYSALPIVPPFGFVKPENFPNFGLNRSQTITHTAFPQNYGGVSQLQYGQEYKYLVTAYAVSKSNSIRRGFRVLRSNMYDGFFSVVPQPQPSNTTYNLKNGDIITTNWRDLGTAPTVIGQEYVIDARYRVHFDTPDTTYSILRSTNKGATYETMKSNLKYTMNTPAQDSSRIVDGILIDVNKITNRGVIRDPGDPLTSQTLNYGWIYQPASNRFVEGAAKFRVGHYQSRSMSLVYPSQGFYNNVGSKTKPEELGRVSIIFDNTNGQTAYRFRADTNQAIYDNFYLYDQMINVPFKVYDTDIATGERRQVNVAIVNSYDPNANPRMQFGFNPTADSLGGKVLVYIFNSDYSPNPDTAYTTKNLFLSVQVDIQYVWAPKLLQPGASPTPGDSLTIYPYSITRPGLVYEFSTEAPTVSIKTISTEIPMTYFLEQNYPNPFNPMTRIRFSVPERTRLSLRIYNSLGQLVTTLINNSVFDAGTSEVTFDGSGLSSGIYFYVLQSDNFVESKKMVLLK